MYLNLKITKVFVQTFFSLYIQLVSLQITYIGLYHTGGQGEGGAEQ